MKTFAEVNHLFVRAIACVLLVAGYMLPICYPRTSEKLIATNDLWPEVGIVARPNTAPDVRSSVRLLVLLLSFAFGGVLLFEVGKLLLIAARAASFLRCAAIASAQFLLVADCIRVYAWDWWLFLTGSRSGGIHWPWIAAIPTVAAIALVLLPLRSSRNRGDDRLQRLD